MNEKAQACKEFISSPTHRLAVGWIITGLGIGLVISAYLQLPHKE